MDKPQFIKDLKVSIAFHYQNINEKTPLISFGIYSDSDASTLSLYYNTEDHLKACLDNRDDDTDEEYYIFFIEEWKTDISYLLREKRLGRLNQLIGQYGYAQYEVGNENYKDEIFDLFASALVGLKSEGLFDQESEKFFLHIEASDSEIDQQMLERMMTILPSERFIAYQTYAARLNN